MRIVFTSLFAFIFFRFAGGLVAQLLAVASHAQEEYILARLFLRRTDDHQLAGPLRDCPVRADQARPDRLDVLAAISRRGLINAQVGA
ncbi:hypothetical protein [Mesorhizobium sp. Root695]|uniref:hypothetical protein n=1 Tax=Mesorhizobium sp. Root695 TaxID=1736589 RepID=UPI001FCDDD68|nr:hypothetical protein [Mesorhizobium sp. Root695]